MRVIPLTAAAEPLLAPDLLWSGTTGDLVLDLERQDLRSRSAIATAVLICLQTDRRVDASELPDGETNRGWPGDAFDRLPGDVPLGSRLWLLRRRALTDDIELLAEDYARDALQPLLDQRLAVRADVVVTSRRETNRLEIAVSLFGREGNQLYHERFAVLWDQIDGS